MQITIDLDSYDVNDAEVALLKHIILNHPGYSKERVAKELGISLRTLFRRLAEHKLTINNADIK